MIASHLVDAAADLIAFLEASGRRSCLIGGLVVSRWGEPRLTHDVDAIVLTDFGGEGALLDLLLTKYRSREPDAPTIAATARMALLESPNGVFIDISFAAFPFEEQVLDRSSTWQVTPDVGLRTCSAEDLVIYKLVAARLIDIHDVQTVVTRQGPSLDVQRVREWGALFAELLERPDLLDPFERALRKPGRLS